MPSSTDASLILDLNDPSGWEGQEELDYSKVTNKSNTDRLPFLPVVQRLSVPSEVENWQKRKYSGIDNK